MTEEEFGAAYWGTDGLADQIYEFLSRHPDMTSVTVSILHEGWRWPCETTWDWVDE